MFGMIPKRKPLFQPPEPYRTPGIGEGHTSPVSAAMPQAASEPQKGGFFAPGGTGRAIAGHMGDFLLQQADMQPIYQPQMQLQQAMAAKQREASLKRDADMQDWLAKQQWERANPKPVNNDTVADYDFILRTLGPEKAREFLENKANPPVWRQGEDGAFYRMDTQGDMPPIGTILPDPRKLGGGGGNATSNFREAFAEFAR